MKRFLQLLIYLWIAFMCSPAHAEVIGGVDFPKKLGGFELRSAIDNDKSRPGSDVTLQYKAPGVKVDVYVYSHSGPNIPNGVDSSVVREEFALVSSAVQRFSPDAQILVREERFSVDGIQLLHSAFQYTEMKPGSREAVNSHLYLTARKGKFIKIRATYSFSDRPELGYRDQVRFVEGLCQILAKY